MPAKKKKKKIGAILLHPPFLEKNTDLPIGYHPLPQAIHQENITDQINDNPFAEV